MSSERKARFISLLARWRLLDWRSSASNPAKKLQDLAEEEDLLKEYKEWLIQNPATSPNRKKKQQIQQTEIRRDAPQIGRGGNSALENLPTELRYMIIRELRHNDFRALVRASPVYYKDLVSDCDYLFRPRVWSHVDSNQIDAWALQTVCSMTFSETQGKQQVLRFLNEYQSLRDSDVKVINTAEPETLVRMFAYHQMVVRPWAYAFAASASKMAQKISGPQKGYTIPTRIEQARFERAVYRFQLFIDVFRLWHPYVPLVKNDFTSIEMLDHFFGIFEPWEVHEVYCFCEFVRKLLSQKSWVKMGGFRYFDGSWVPMAEVFTQLRANEGVTQSGRCPGLESFMSFVKPDRIAASTGQELILLAAVQHLMTEVLSLETQRLRRQQAPSYQDQKEKHQAVLDFKRDRKDGVSSSWVRLTGRRYLNLYGPAIPTKLNEVAFLMWNASWLEAPYIDRMVSDAVSDLRTAAYSMATALP